MTSNSNNIQETSKVLESIVKQAQNSNVLSHKLIAMVGTSAIFIGGSDDLHTFTYDRLYVNKDGISEAHYVKKPKKILFFKFNVTEKLYETISEKDYPEIIKKYNINAEELQKVVNKKGHLYYNPYYEKGMHTFDM